MYSKYCVWTDWVDGRAAVGWEAVKLAEVQLARLQATLVDAAVQL